MVTLIFYTTKSLRILSVYIVSECLPTRNKNAIINATYLAKIPLRSGKTLKEHYVAIWHKVHQFLVCSLHSGMQQ